MSTNKATSRGLGKCSVLLSHVMTCLRSLSLTHTQHNTPARVHIRTYARIIPDPQCSYADLPRFIALAGQNGLSVVVRIGPYICGEYYFGGTRVLHTLRFL